MTKMQNYNRQGPGLGGIMGIWSFRGREGGGVLLVWGLGGIEKV